jgi:heme exporter protein B
VSGREVPATTPERAAPPAPAAPVPPHEDPPPRATPTRAVVAALIRKDLRLELRTAESVPAMALFSISTFVLFHFGLDARSVAGDLAAGVFWVTLLFAAVLAVNRLFVAEREQGGFDGFLLAPVDRTALFLAKAAVLFAFLVALEVIAVPAFAILLLEPSPWPGLPELAGMLLLADLGLAAVGTLVGALAVQTRARDLIVPLLALPLAIPVVIAAARGTAPLWLEAGAEAVPGRWPAILGLYDLTFGLLAYAIFDYLLEE